jgi:segregation and condensation protein A
MSYSVKLEVFEGPFDLLFHLIEKNEVDIYDIPIAVITRQYLQYLDGLRFFDIEIASEFLVMAATLLHIKSKMLLPNPKDETMEEDEDPRQQLVERLMEYKKYKEVTGELKKREEIFLKRLFREPSAAGIDGHQEPVIPDIGLAELHRAFEEAMKKYRELYNSDYDLKKSLEKERVSVTEKIKHIIKVLKPGRPVKFDKLFEGFPTRETVVATFLALLELIKERKVLIEQESNFGDIIIRKR